MISLVVAIEQCAGPQGNALEVAGETSWDGLPTYVLDSLADLELGAATDPAAPGFTLVQGGLLLPGRRVAVADGLTRTISVFDESGVLTTMGGRGGGPGEFRALAWFGWGSTAGPMATLDRPSAAIVLFDLNGNFVDRIVPDLTNGGTSATMVGFLSDSVFVLSTQRSEMSLRGLSEGVRRDSIEFHLFEYEEERDVLPLPGPERYFRNRDGIWGVESMPLARTTLAVTTWGMLVVATNDQPSLLLYDRTGQSVGEIVLPFARREVTPVDVSAERRRTMVAITDSLSRSRVLQEPMRSRLLKWRREAVAAAPAGTHFPFVRELRVDGEGWLWVRPGAPAAERVGWYVVDPGGTGLKRVILPADVHWLDARGDDILILTKGAFDEPVVRRHRLVRATS